MSLKIFIAGTDTNIGKTYVTAKLLQALSGSGLKTIGIKPLATGGFWEEQKFYNEDALALQSHASVKLPYSMVNPIIYEPAIAPHLAAAEQGRELSANLLLESCSEAFKQPADVCLIEGVGGWHTPLNDHETMADFVKLSGCGVILVVGMRLGCLNHTLLTAATIAQANIPTLGWIANCIDPHMLKLTENIETLYERLTMPLLGIIPWQPFPPITHR